jgi:hypothetical protein
MQIVRAAAAAAGLLALSATRAEAYLDPGSGSMLLQLLLGGAAGLAVAIRLSWRRLTARLRGDRAERGRP